MDSPDRKPADPNAREPLAPAQPTPPLPETDAVESLLRLVVGAAALGTDELLKRLRAWEAEVLHNPHRSAPLPAETPAVRARYALIGLLFLASRAAREAAVDFANYSEKQANNAYHLLSGFARTPVIGILARPMKAGVDALLRTRDRELERWIRIGRVEERDGRRIAAMGIEELSREVVDAISKNDKLKTAISNLVQQQSLDLTGEIVDDLRQGAKDADDRLEAAIWRLLGREPHRSGESSGDQSRKRRTPN
ncbi:MAG: hypothetical protein RMN52_12960 [Anaerolineae bacterium]|nr:hypothetical protein [Candidatus Roseilinea sp.]MDW8450901.1 hypothetical protein [Anaerolineae bacterium]